jgi:hypothetical protein
MKSTVMIIIKPENVSSDKLTRPLIKHKNHKTKKDVTRELNVRNEII